jgi:hypothetical protein
MDKHPSLQRWVHEDPGVRERLRNHPEFLVNRGRYWNRQHKEGNFNNPAGWQAYQERQAEHSERVERRMERRHRMHD